MSSLVEAERAHHAAASAADDAAEFASPRTQEASPPAYERETVAEFQPQEAPVQRETSPVAQSAPSSGPGYAPAAPVKIDWPSDLQQVESDPQKVRAAVASVAEEPVAPRPKRVRPSAPVTENEPLVQIETGRAASGSDEKTPA